MIFVVYNRRVLHIINMEIAAIAAFQNDDVRPDPDRHVSDIPEDDVYAISASELQLPDPGYGIQPRWVDAAVQESKVKAVQYTRHIPSIFRHSLEAVRSFDKVYCIIVHLIQYSHVVVSAA